MKSIKAQNLFECLDEKWKYIAMDENKRTCRFSVKPIIEMSTWKVKGILNYDYVNINVDWSDISNDWTKCILERPKDESDMIGMFGKFWDDSMLVVKWGYLERIINRPYRFKIKDGISWANFEPCLPRERIEIEEL